MQEFRRIEADETNDLLHAGGDGLRGLSFAEGRAFLSVRDLTLSSPLLDRDGRLAGTHGDPVGIGHVASLERPGATHRPNDAAHRLVVKELEAFKEALPPG